MTPQKAYRLGTIARLVLRKCRQVNLAGATHDDALCLVGEWGTLLTEIKGRFLDADVRALKACIEAEKRIHDAQAQYECRRKRYQVLTSMNQDVPPPEKPGA